MADNDSSLTGSTPAPAATEGQNTGTNLPPSGTETKPAIGQTADQKPNDTSYDVEWWKKDPRFGKIWHTEQDFPRLYKSADEVLETKYKPAFKQYEGLQKKLKEYGIEPDRFDEYAKEYQLLKDPNNPDLVRSSYFKQWLENPLYSDKVKKFYEDIELAEQERQYPNMTAEARAKMMELEGRVNKYDEMLANQKKEQEYAAHKKTINSGLDEIKKLSASKGFDFTDEIRNQFIDECIKNKVSPQNFVYEFMKKFNEALDKSGREKTRAELIAEMNKKNTTQIKMTGKPPVVGESKKTTLEEKLQSLFKT